MLLTHAVTAFEFGGQTAGRARVTGRGVLAQLRVNQAQWLVDGWQSPIGQTAGLRAGGAGIEIRRRSVSIVLR